MKRIITLLLICFVYSFSFGQTVTKGSGAQVTVNNAHTFTQYTFRPPVYVDTAVANMAITLDSCGKIIFTYDGNKLWKRHCNPKMWVEIGGSGGGSTNTSVGTGYPLAITGTNNVKKLRDSTGISIDSAVSNTLRITNTLPGKTTVLDSISDVASFAGLQTTNLVIKDTLRGGNFYEYDGTDTADNGMIFEDALGRKWLRSTVNDLIHTKWYGLNTLSTRIDNYTAITKARDYIYAHPTFKTLHIDANAGGVGIYRLYQIKFTQAINIEGDFTTGDLPATKISFLMNSNGLVFQPYNSNFSISVSNLSIENEFDFLTRDTSKALIKSHCVSYIKNVRMPYVSGVGIELSGCIDGDSTTNPIFGNCDFSYIENCNVYESLHGYKTAGCDANSITFLNCLSQAAVRWGIKDSGQLGNHYINCHFQGNSNNSISGAATQVSYAGKYYAALTAHDDGSGIGKRPDLNLFTYWVERDPCAAAAWDTTKHYWSGGAITVENPNATTNISNPYIEVDDGIIILNSRSDVTGGTNGVGVVVGGSRRWTSLGIYTIASSVRIQDTGNPNTTNTFGVNAEPLGTEMARIKNKVGVNTLLSLEGYNGFSLMNFANVGYPTNGVSVGSYYGEFRVYPKLGEGFSADEIALMPQNNNTYDLGKSGQTWKDIYATLSNGAGNKAVRWNTGGKITLIDTLITSAGWGNLISGTYPNIIIGADSSLLATKLYVKHYNDSIKATILSSIRDTVWALTQSFRLGTSATRTTDVTLSNVTGFSANLLNGATYTFEAKLYTTSNVAGGVNYAIGGTATASSIVYEGLTTDAGLTTQSRGTAMAASVGNVTAVTAAYTVITGTIVCSATGSLTLQFAQNASNAATSTILAGSTFIVTRIN